MLRVRGAEDDALRRRHRRQQALALGGERGLGEVALRCDVEYRAALSRHEQVLAVVARVGDLAGDHHLAEAGHRRGADLRDDGLRAQRAHGLDRAGVGCPRARRDADGLGRGADGGRAFLRPGRRRLRAGGEAEGTEGDGQESFHSGFR
jgi:hypothetical protein